MVAVDGFPVIGRGSRSRTFIGAVGRALPIQASAGTDSGRPNRRLGEPRKGLAMDRRMPPIRCRVVAMPVVLGVALLLSTGAWGMDPESRPVSLHAVSDAAAGSFGWLPWLVCVAGLGVAGWFMLRRTARMRTLPQGGIQVMDRTVMGRGRALSLVRVGDRVVLVGESAQGFQRLAEFDAATPADEMSVARRLAS